MIQLNFINYSKFFNDTIKASLILFDKSFKHTSLDKYREFVVEKLSISLDDLAIPNQVHSNQVQWIEKSGIYEKVDGLLTDNKKIIKTGTEN